MRATSPFFTHPALTMIHAVVCSDTGLTHLCRFADNAQLKTNHLGDTYLVAPRRTGEPGAEQGGRAVGVEEEVGEAEEEVDDGGQASFMAQRAKSKRKA